jgi:hypothetical protein
VRCCSWLDVGFGIQIASNYYDGYDKLLDVFRDIGSSLPQFQEIFDSFPRNTPLDNFFGLFYTEVIEFHFQALRFFRQTSRYFCFLARALCLKAQPGIIYAMIKP